MSEPTTRFDVNVALWYYTATDEAPSILRRIADDLEATDGALIGLWQTGFGAPHEVTIQVAVDLNDAHPPTVPGHSDEETSG